MWVNCARITRIFNEQRTAIVSERRSVGDKWQMPRARLTPGGGGGGTQIWFRRGCAAELEAAKPVPIFKGHFGGKGYPLNNLRVFTNFSQENDVFVYL